MTINQALAFFDEIVADRLDTSAEMLREHGVGEADIEVLMGRNWRVTGSARRWPLGCAGAARRRTKPRQLSPKSVLRNTPAARYFRCADRCSSDPDHMWACSF